MNRKTLGKKATFCPEFFAVIHLSTETQYKLIHQYVPLATSANLCNFSHVVLGLLD